MIDNASPELVLNIGDLVVVEQAEVKESLQRLKSGRSRRLIKRVYRVGTSRSTSYTGVLTCARPVPGSGRLMECVILTPDGLRSCVVIVCGVVYDDGPRPEIRQLSLEPGQHVMPYFVNMESDD